MKLLAGLALMLTSLTTLAQTPHITQPFFYYWDYNTANINGSSGVQQVAHFEIVLDGNPTALPLTISNTPSTSPGDTTFKLAADINLPLGNHVFNIIACPTLVSSTVAGSGCSAGAAIPFVFVLDPRPLPSVRRLGVGV